MSATVALSHINNDMTNFGLLLGGIAFGGAAVFSFMLMAWWPLVVGFIAAWVLRLLDFDPG